MDCIKGHSVCPTRHHLHEVWVILKAGAMGRLAFHGPVLEETEQNIMLKWKAGTVGCRHTKRDLWNMLAMQHTVHSRVVQVPCTRCDCHVADWGSCHATIESHSISPRERARLKAYVCLPPFSGWRSLNLIIVSLGLCIDAIERPGLTCMWSVISLKGQSVILLAFLTLVKSQRVPAVPHPIVRVYVAWT